MKKILFVSLFALTCFNLSAQSAGKPKFHHPNGEQHLSAEERAILQSKQMALHLDLSEKQQQEVQALLGKRHADIEAQRASRNADSAAIQDQKHRFTRMNAHLDAQLAFNRELKSIIGEGKFETWRQFHKPQRYWHNPSRTPGAANIPNHPQRPKRHE
ncbi:MAG: hypothetical protein RLZZ241_2083 [Bacteroidota bacterium]|jgi:hypothetical protein